MEQIKETIQQAITSIGIYFSETQISATMTYLQNLETWNSETNLVSKNDIPNLLDRHFLDSLFPLKYFEIHEQASLLDIGSGGGFPSIPLKIARPDIRLTCVESKHRKCEFLKETGSLLSFTDYNVINMLLTHHQAGLGLFDFIISRGVMEIRKFLKLAKYFLNKSGKVIIFKTENSLQEELKRVNNANISSYFRIGSAIKYKSGTDLCLIGFDRLNK